MSTVTCHDPTDVGCINKDEPIQLELTSRDETGRVSQTSTVFCGVCGQPITDIQR